MCIERAERCQSPQGFEPGARLFFKVGDGAQFLVLNLGMGSAERERERFHAGIEKLDLELPLGDRSRLSNQLIQALLGDRAVAFVVDISSWAAPGGRPSMNTRKRTAPPARGWPHDEVEIARMKPERDPPAGSVQHGSLCLHRPFTGKRPLIEAQARRSGIESARVHRGTTGRRELLGFVMADVCFGRLQAAPICADLWTMRLDGHGLTFDRAAAPGGGQQSGEFSFPIRS